MEKLFTLQTELGYKAKDSLVLVKNDALSQVVIKDIYVSGGSNESYAIEIDGLELLKLASGDVLEGRIIVGENEELKIKPLNRYTKKRGILVADNGGYNIYNIKEKLISQTAINAEYTTKSNTSSWNYTHMQQAFLKDGFIYYANSNTQAIEKVDYESGEKVKTKSVSSLNIQRLGYDDTYLYYSSSTDKGVRRLLLSDLSEDSSFYIAELGLHDTSNYAGRWLIVDGDKIYSGNDITGYNKVNVGSISQKKVVETLTTKKTSSYYHPSGIIATNSLKEKFLIVPSLGGGSTTMINLDTKEQIYLPSAGSVSSSSYAGQSAQIDEDVIYFRYNYSSSSFYDATLDIKNKKWLNASNNYSVFKSKTSGVYGFVLALDWMSEDEYKKIFSKETIRIAGVQIK